MDEKELDNLAQEELPAVEEDDDDDDIEFDDINFDAITQQLQEHVDVDFSAPEDEEIPYDDNPPSPTELSLFDSIPKEACKKYVVYIEPTNVDIVDGMSVDDRNKLINSIISEKYENDKRSRIVRQRRLYAKRLMIICLTVIIGFPVMFFIVNKSLEASISNYAQAEKNFEKLYKERGKVMNYQNLDVR